MKSEELAKLGLGQFPLVIGGVVPVINIDGVKPGQLKFTGALLADIFLGKIRKWNDPALRALNPDVRLPDASISAVTLGSLLDQDHRRPKRYRGQYFDSR